MIFKKKILDSNVVSRVVDSIRNNINYRYNSNKNGICNQSAISNLDTKYLEYLYINSWSASKIIDIPAEDMFLYPRQITNIDDDLLFVEFAKKIKLQEKILKAIKSSRVMGTSFLVMICDDNIFSNPISPNAKLINLVNFSRSDTTIKSFDTNLSSVNFLNPLLYEFRINLQTPIQVHHSRVIRVDTISPLSVNGFIDDTSQKWGISELIRCYDSIKNEECVSKAIKTLTQEASIPIMKAGGLQEALAGEADAFENKAMTLDKFVSNINDLKSIYSTIMIGENMSLERLAVNFSGLPEVFDRFNQQLAAVADIPMTRFFGQSTKGLNNSGESDLKNYYTTIGSMQQNILTPIYDQVDPVIKNTLNIEYDYIYPPLMVQSAIEKSTAGYNNAQRDQIYLVNGVLTPEEIKENLYDDETYQSIERGLDSGATIDTDNIQ